MSIVIVEIRRKYEVPKEVGAGETLVMRSSFYATPSSPLSLFSERELSSFFCDLGCSSIAVLDSQNDYVLFSLSGGEESEDSWTEAWMKATGSKFMKISDIGISVVPPFSTWSSRPGLDVYAKAEVLLLSKEKGEGSSRSSL